jgi:exodeoxyribonuclease-3
MKVATFNAASVRARQPQILEWLAENEPDVLAIQETKVEDEKFPGSDFEDLGYHLSLHGQKSWNGVALLSRSLPTDVGRGFDDALFPNDARLVTAEIDGVRFINTYVPNGSSVGSDKFIYKLRWLERFGQFLRERYSPTQPLIWMGDVNIAPTPLDVYNSPRFFGGVGHHPEEFARLEKIVGFGLVDVFRKFHPERGHYTFWDYTLPNGFERNLGWRIDHIYATAPLAEACISCDVDLEARRQLKPSDHTFVTATFDI